MTCTYTRWDSSIALKMSHMIADSTEELLEMARKIGVDVKWIQDRGTPREHFDVCMSKRVLAIKAGAKEITWKQLGVMVLDRASKNYDLHGTTKNKKEYGRT